MNPIPHTQTPAVAPTVDGYWSTRQLCERFDCSSRTLGRWEARETNPFPKPALCRPGCQNRYSIAEVLEWEAREKELHQQRQEQELRNQ